MGEGSGRLEDPVQVPFQELARYAVATRLLVRGVGARSHQCPEVPDEPPDDFWVIDIVPELRTTFPSWLSS